MLHNIKSVSSSEMTSLTIEKTFLSLILEKKLSYNWKKLQIPFYYLKCLVCFGLASLENFY